MISTPCGPIWKKVASVCFFFLFSVVMIAARNEQVRSQQKPSRREARWKEDLDFFANKFAKSHKDFTKLYPAKQFDRELSDILQAVPRSPDSEVVLALMKLVASAHVVHTSVDFPPAPLAFHSLPLLMYWYSDGLVVTSAAEAYKEALGMRVVRIGSMTPEQLEAAVAPYISYETDIWLHTQSPYYMTTVELLRLLKQTREDGRVDLTLANMDGKLIRLAVSGAEPGATNHLVTVWDALHLPYQLSRKHPDSYYYYEYLADSQALYIQYNKCQEDPKLSFADFIEGMFKFADAHTIQCVVVDLRFNLGGKSWVIKPMEKKLLSRPSLIARGHLYALIGRMTVSSGVFAAVDLRNRLHALLIGEPAGEKPNSYGQKKTLTLPNSRLQVNYSTRFFTLMKKADPPTYDPDIKVLQSFADVMVGRDPVLDAALRHPLE